MARGLRPNHTTAELSGTGLHSSELATIRGWLLLFAIILVPHIVTSAVILAHSWPFVPMPDVEQDLRAVERLRSGTQAVIFIGNSVGLALLSTRNRYAPAYFTLYLPLLVLLFMADPDTIATQVAYAERLGLFDAAERAKNMTEARTRTVLSLSVTAVAFGYWLRSRRVYAVFGSTGLGGLWRSGRADTRST